MKERTIEVAVSSSFTDEPAGIYIKKWLSVFQIEASIHFAPYNQIFQELYDENSVLSSIQKGVQILLIRFEDLIKDSNRTDEWKQHFLKEQLEQLKGAITINMGNSKRIVGILPPSEEVSHSPMGIFIEGLNDEWLDFMAGTGIISTVDMRRAAKPKDTYNSFTDEMAHMPYQETFYDLIGCMLSRKIYSFYKAPFKVIVVDCDNTLWTGICGEAGAKEVVIDQGRVAFQKFLLECFNKGILLAIASKNNEADVMEVFEQREDMVLKSEHFICKKINWNPKYENIRTIAEELNLGLSSFLFLDDSKAECNEMMFHCTEVLTLKIPEESSSVIEFISNIWAFDVNDVLEDDQFRTKYYLEEQSRLASKKKHMSIDEYIESLDVKVYVFDAEEEDIKRISQLTQRTNQFNLTTQRLTESDVVACLNDEKILCKVIAVEDKFGSYGSAGALFVSEQRDALFINLFLLSCRVLGRGVENQLLAYIQRIGARNHKKMFKADFYPTDRNEQVRTFMNNTGWVKESYTGSYETFTMKAGLGDWALNVTEERPKRIEALSVAKDIHHIGVAVKDMKKAMEKYRKNGYQVGVCVEDELQNSLLVMCKKEQHLSVELVAPLNGESSINHYIKEDEEVPYHICVEVLNHESLYKVLKNQKIPFDIISEPKNAILFHDKKVGFIYVKAFGLIEYIEVKQFHMVANCEANLLQVFTSNMPLAKDVAALFGYRMEGGEFINHFNHGRIQLLKKSTLHSKDTDYIITEYMENKDTKIEDMETEKVYNKKDFEVFVVNEDQLLHRSYYEPLRYWAKRRKGGGKMESRNTNDKVKIITDMAKRILGVDCINIEDNLYKAGGNSFMVIKLLSEIYDVFQEEIPLVYAFENPNIKSLCEYIQS